MLFGLSLIGTMLQPYAERLSIYVLMWGSDYRSMSSMVRKNLSAHSGRNIKTAIMFTTSLSFIIFAGSAFSLQAHTLGATVSMAAGGDIVVYALRNPLDESSLRNFLNQKMSETKPLIHGYTFTTFPLSRSTWMGNDYISNLAGYPSVLINIHGIEENYLNETYTEFLRYTEEDEYNKFKYSKTSNGRDDVVKSLYTDGGKAKLPIEANGITIPPPVISIASDEDREYFENKLDKAYSGYIDVLCSEALRYTVSVDTKTPMKLSVGVRDASRNNYLVKSRAMISSMPGFIFSTYRQAAILSPVLVTMPTFYRLMKDGWDAKDRGTTKMEEVPNKAGLRVRMTSKHTQLDREVIINGLRNYIKDSTTQIVDTQDILDSTQVAVNLLNLFFYIVSVISVVLCFLVLWLSFTANVNENAWEFVVLRAIGLTANAVIRMYVYEALCLILSSVVIGSTIGMLVSVTLTLQFNLFTQLPFTFDFPYALFSSVLVMSILVAIAGSYFPALSIKRKDIAIALKNL